MTDSPRDSSRQRHQVDREAFARFLKFLSPDEETAARTYTRMHEKLVGFFNLKGISDPVSAADETIDRAVIKIEAGTTVSDVQKYCSGIARNIARERLRLAARETSAFHNFIENLENNSDEQVERIYNLLKPCFEQLSVEEQRLLMAYCQIIQGRARAEHRRQLATDMQTTVLALRMRVTRLRNNLSDCVKNLSNAA
ncbi:MAG TPA: hypothetical protein VF717_16585 [Pyrinomonadaceae bacterium]|jgi:hypothetical protein